MRARRLSKIFNKQISFIYIQRTPISVVESFQKKSVEQPPKSRMQANLYLLLVNILASRTIKKLNKSHKTATISYTDLTNNTISTLNHLEQQLSIDLTETKELIKNNQPLKVGSLFDSNRLRLKNEVKINKSHQSQPEKAIDKLFHSIHKAFWYKSK